MTQEKYGHLEVPHILPILSIMMCYL